MEYIFKADRERMRIVERCIAEVMGCDKDTYLDERKTDRRTRIARYSWVYWVYHTTMLDHHSLAEMINRNQSNVSRAIQNVENWMMKPSRREYQYVKEIKNKIKNEIK